MSWGDKISHKNRLEPHHIYQLEVIFLFTAGFFAMIPFWMLVKEYNLDMTQWQWYYIIPWMIFFVVYSLKQRTKISIAERTSPLKRPLLLWILLGLSIIMFHLQPTVLSRLYGMDFAFIILSLFVADAYLDFKK